MGQDWFSGFRCAQQGDATTTGRRFGPSVCIAASSAARVRGVLPFATKSSSATPTCFPPSLSPPRSARQPKASRSKPLLSAPEAGLATGRPKPLPGSGCIMSDSYCNRVRVSISQNYRPHCQALIIFFVVSVLAQWLPPSLHRSLHSPLVIFYILSFYFTVTINYQARGGAGLVQRFPLRAAGRCYYHRPPNRSVRMYSSLLRG